MMKVEKIQTFINRFNTSQRVSWNDSNYFESIQEWYASKTHETIHPKSEAYGETI